MIGAKEDSLGLLVVIFILPLNDDMVYFITGFEEQRQNPGQTEYNPHATCTGKNRLGS